MSIITKLYKNVGLLDTIFPYYQRLPNVLHRIVAKEFARKAHQEIRKHSLPNRLTFFVTNKCNLRCSHCFYIDELNSRVHELDIDEISALASSLKGNVSQLVLTGGEAFLREDLADIVRVFEQLAGIESASILTSGFFPQRVEKTVREITQKTSLALNFQISIDGVKQKHNAIRKNTKSFDNAFQTIDVLQGLRRANDNIGRISTLTTVGRSNYDDIERIIAELSQLEKVSYGFTFARSTIRDISGTFNREQLSGFEPGEDVCLTVEQMKESYKRIEECLWSKSKASLFYGENKAILRNLIRLKETNFESSFKCMAGITDFIIYPNGDVALCEMFQPFGSLKKYDFNVQSFWKKEYESYKKTVLGCKCTHSCNIASMIKYDKDELYDLFSHQR